MNNIYYISKLIQENAPDLSGIFTATDLAALIGTSNSTLLPRKIRQLEDAGILTKFMRGIYIVKENFDPQILSQRLCEQSYISLETVLARNLVIGPIPSFRMTAVKLGRRKTYKSQSLTIEHLSIDKRLFFGFERLGAINIADSEKAFLDCLYFYQKGRRLTFNFYEDVNFQKLDIAKIESYIRAFKNPKFIKFVGKVLKNA